MLLFVFLPNFQATQQHVMFLLADVISPSLMGDMKSEAWVCLVALSAFAGHVFPVFLKFKGGKGMGATFGALFVLLPLHGYWQGLVILFAIILVPFIITHNVALSMAIGLLALPFIIGLGMKSGIGTIVAVVLGLVVLIKFLPTARTALAKSETTKDFIFDRRQREKKEER